MTETANNEPAADGQRTRPGGRAWAIVRACRPYQWVKNLLLFVPVFAAHDASGIWLALLGFIPFCLTASAVYVLNDISDIEADRAHPRKRFRPFAAGDLSARTGFAMAASLLVSAFAFAWFLGKPVFILVLLAYLGATFAYTIWLKRTLLLDILSLAGLYTLRVIAGGVAAGVSLSPWLLGFSMFVFLSLAAVKRQAELVDQSRSGRTASGRAYEVEDIPIVTGLALSAGTASILVLALYISLEGVQRLYPRPELLWLMCPLVLYWILRMVMKAHRGEMTDDPIIFAAKDPVGVGLVLLCGAIAVLAAIQKFL